MHQYTLLLFICLFSLACQRPQKQVSSSSTSASIKYATGFTIEESEHGTLVTITTPWQGASKPVRYLLVKDEPAPSDYQGATIIKVPVETVVCTSTTHIPLLDYLDASNKLIGFPSLEYISSPLMRARIDSGLVEELGVDKGMNIEKIAVLSPSLVMAYTMTGDWGQFKKIEELGIPVVLNAEYLERHPLGRAEWIKFVGAFLGKEQQADSVFTAIEREYNRVKSLADKTTDKPVVLSGIVYGNAWFLPGGQNYAARLFEDAGCQYLYGDDPSTGYLQLSFENVYAKAIHADLWLGVGSFASRQELADADRRYASLNPFINNQVYSYEKRMGPTGGSEYLELGYLRPDYILKDLVKIAHPELLPEHELFFYKRVE